MSTSQPICKYFKTSRGCRFGDRCRFSHPCDQTEPMECRFNNTAKGCRYGGDCLFEHKDLACVCFKCQQNFTSVKDLREHMKSTLVRCNPDHLIGVTEPKNGTKESLSCSVCCNVFEGVTSILQHIGCKAERDNEHSKLLDEIVAHFVTRCLSVCEDVDAWKDKLHKELLSSGEAANDDKKERLNVLMHLHLLTNSDNDSDDDDDSGNVSEEFEDEERMMNCGFSNHEVHELLCQGVKPWDDDAWAVMSVLNGIINK